jgi:anion-transporting  ArsA/GET3 family ATPase
VSRVPTGPAGGAGAERDDRLRRLLTERQVVVCAGAGGVGKTSVAAALAIEAAAQGRRVVVLTIDPARRLADALGLSGLPNVPHRIEGPWPGELHAAMLDTRATFDELIARHAAGPDQVRRILDNRFYRNISHALSGTQEYMAAEKLHELHASDRFELIVVDTPPTRQALDFLDAPEQLARFLDHRVYRLLTGSGGRWSRTVGRAATAVVRTAGRLVGTAVLDDAVAFFAAFDGMEAGFRDRAEQVRTLLRSPSTAFVVVAGPQADTVAEAEFFLGQIAAEGVALGAVVANRLLPRFGPAEADDLAHLAEAHAGTGLAELVANLTELTAAADAEDRILQRLAPPSGAVPLVRVPLLDHDVHDLEALDQLRSHLFGGG